MHPLTNHKSYDFAQILMFKTNKIRSTGARWWCGRPARANNIRCHSNKHLNWKLLKICFHSRRWWLLIKSVVLQQLENIGISICVSVVCADDCEANLSLHSLMGAVRLMCHLMIPMAVKNNSFSKKDWRLINHSRMKANDITRKPTPTPLQSLKIWFQFFFLLPKHKNLMNGN